MNTAEFSSSIPSVPRGESLPDVPWLKSLRYERMDEHSPSATGVHPDKQRMVAVPDVERRVWGPYFLGIYDLSDIIESGALWIRKVRKSQAKQNRPRVPRVPPPFTTHYFIIYYFILNRIGSFSWAECYQL